MFSRFLTIIAEQQHYRTTSCRILIIVELFSLIAPSAIQVKVWNSVAKIFVFISIKPSVKVLFFKWGEGAISKNLGEVGCLKRRGGSFRRDVGTCKNLWKKLWKNAIFDMAVVVLAGVHCQLIFNLVFFGNCLCKDYISERF